LWIRIRPIPQDLRESPHRLVDLLRIQNLHNADGASLKRPQDDPGIALGCFVRGALNQFVQFLLELDGCGQLVHLIGTVGRDLPELLNGKLPNARGLPAFFPSHAISSFSD